MPESNTINLVPSEVLKERTLKNQYKRFLFFSLIILVLSFISFAFVTYLLNNSNNELNRLKSTVSQKQDEITKLEDVAKKGSILTARLAYIDNILKNRVYYSKVMEEIKARSKSGVVVTGLDIKNLEDTYETTLSGVASSTVLLQDYMLGLVAKPDNLFSNPKILEVTVREGESTARFKISLETDKKLLLER